MSDIELNYVAKGEGEVLIFLHGNGEDMSYFEHQFEFFSHYYLAVAIDTRGHGNTPRGDGELSLKRASEDLYDFFISHEISKAHLLGFSDGGNIALLFALKHPEKVGKLILNGANLFPMGLKPKVLNQIIHEWNVARKTPGRKREAEILELMVKEPNISISDLKLLDIPTLVVVGDDDVIRPKHSRLIASSLPKASFVSISGSHSVAYDNPDSFNKTVFDFLSL